MQIAQAWLKEANKNSLRMFGILVFVLEVFILIFYGSFVRMQTVNFGDPISGGRYGAFQDTNIMILIGFGFLMTFIKTNALTALTYTFFINAIVMQLYILFFTFWRKLMVGFANTQYYIYIQQIIITKSSYCVASVLIAFGGIIGRVGPKQLLIAAVMQVIGYSFNEVINEDKIQTFDAGGSTTIHAFGAYFGLGMSWVLSKKIKPITKTESNSNSNTFAMIGTLFLWIFWPSFNFGVQAQSLYQQNQILVNTLYSLTGSCLSTFMMSAFLGKHLKMEDILNATLAGGVVIGASSGYLYHPALAIAIGMTAGVVSTLSFHYLTPLLEKKFRIYDTCGIHNLHGIPGVLGGSFSAMIMASYNNGFDIRIARALGNSASNPFLGFHGSFLNQGGLQIAGTLTSVGFGLLFGIGTGSLLNCFYNESADNFYQDKVYIEVQNNQIFNQIDSSLPISHQNEENNERLIDS